MQIQKNVSRVLQISTIVHQLMVSKCSSTTRKLKERRMRSFGLLTNKSTSRESDAPKSALVWRSRGRSSTSIDVNIFTLSRYPTGPSKTSIWASSSR